MALIIPGNDNQTQNGYRYFLDASGLRQYAVKYTNGTPSKNILVFDENGEKSQLRPNETVYAFEAGVQMSADAKGGLKISPLAIQVRVNPDGKAVHFRSSRVAFAAEMKQGLTGVDTTYRMTEASSQLLQEQGFDDAFPRKVGTVEKGTNEFNQEVTASGLFIPASGFSSGGMPFPPQHEKGAEAARKAVEGGDGAAGFEMADAQTLVERKSLGQGESLRTVFDFAAERVTEVFTAPGQAPAATGHAFKDHDAGDLDNARQQLVKLGGTPRALAPKLA